MARLVATNATIIAVSAVAEWRRGERRMKQKSRLAAP